MKTMHAGRLNENAVVISVAIGTAAALIIGAALTAILTSLIGNERIGSESQDISIFLIRTIAVFFGSVLGTGLCKDKYMITVGLITTICFVFLLGAGVLFYDAPIRHFGKGLLSVLAGGVLSCVVGLKPKKKRNKALRRIRG